MGIRTGVVLSLLLGSLVIGGLASGPVGAEESSTIDGQTTLETADTSGPSVTKTYRLVPNASDTIEVTVTFTDMGGEESATWYSRDGVTVIETEGFSQDGEKYKWDGVTATPTVVYHWNVSDGYTVYDGGEWAFGEPTEPWVAASTDGEYAVVSTNQTVVGDGLVTNETLILGEYETYTREIEDGRVRLLVPNAADPIRNPTSTLNIIENASREFDVGVENETTIAVITPVIPSKNLLASGLTVGDRTFWLWDEEASPRTVAHEYVHTRTEFQTEPSMDWVYEGSANYYGNQLLLQSGHLYYERFDGMLHQGHFNTHNLSDPDSSYGTNYDKGATAITAIDRTIRNETDGNKTFQDVFRRLNVGNNATSGVTLGDFRDAVSAVGGPQAVAVADRYVTTQASPTRGMPIAQYADVFGYEPATFDFEVTSAQVNWKGRNRTVDTQSRRGDLHVVAGSTVRLTFTAQNEGGTTGQFRPDIDMWEPGAGDGTDLFTSPWMEWVEPGESAVRNETRTFSKSGEYSIIYLHGSQTIVVHNHSTQLTVTNIEPVVEPTVGRSATVWTTIETDSEWRANDSVSVYAGERRLTTQNVTVLADEQARIPIDVTFERPGTRTITIGNETQTVTVAPAPTSAQTTTGSTSSTPEGTGSGPGFGLVAAFLSIILASAISARRT
jgi:hypothetical protein